MFSWSFTETESGDEVQLILAAREKCVHHAHRDLYFDFRFLRVVLLKNMNEESAIVFGDADVRLFILHGDELAVLGCAYGVKKRPQIDAMAINVIEPDTATVQSILIDGGQNFFGQFQRNVHADGLFVSVGIGDADVQPAIMAGCQDGLAGAAGR